MWNTGENFDGQRSFYMIAPQGGCKSRPQIFRDCRELHGAPAVAVGVRMRLMGKHTTKGEQRLEVSGHDSEA